VTDDPERDLWAEMDVALTEAARAIAAAHQLIHERNDGDPNDRHP
jgi:hypothetical protein